MKRIQVELIVYTESYQMIVYHFDLEFLFSTILFTVSGEIRQIITWKGEEMKQIQMNKKKLQ